MRHAVQHYNDCSPQYVCRGAVSAVSAGNVPSTAVKLIASHFKGKHVDDACVPVTGSWRKNGL